MSSLLFLVFFVPAPTQKLSNSVLYTEFVQGQPKGCSFSDVFLVGVLLVQFSWWAAVFLAKGLVCKGRREEVNCILWVSNRKQHNQPFALGSLQDTVDNPFLIPTKVTKWFSLMEPEGVVIVTGSGPLYLSSQPRSM